MNCKAEDAESSGRKAWLRDYGTPCPFGMFLPVLWYSCLAQVEANPCNEASLVCD